MRKWIIFSLLYFTCAYGSSSLEEYFAYFAKLDWPKGDYREGEIEIVTDPLEISQIQKIQEDRLLRKGFSLDQAREFSRIGIVNEDQYWIWIRDAVYFPHKTPGTYDRLLWKSELTSKSPGVAVLPVFPSGQIALILTYRHATRSWELEIPRGKMEATETLQEAAFRELQEETGLVASSMHFLGEMATDSGVLSSVIPIFMGKICDQKEANPEYSEAIAEALLFTKEELKKGLIRGSLEVFVQGTKKEVPLRDGFLTFALLQAECRKLL